MKVDFLIFVFPHIIDSWNNSIQKGPWGGSASSKSLSISCSLILTVCSCSPPLQLRSLPKLPLHVLPQGHHHCPLPEPQDSNQALRLGTLGSVPSSHTTLPGMRCPVCWESGFLPGGGPCPMEPHHCLRITFIKPFWFWLYIHTTCTFWFFQLSEEGFFYFLFRCL